jgi:hypothetical protein
VSDIDTAAADSLKVLDPERPIREPDIRTSLFDEIMRDLSGLQVRGVTVIGVELKGLSNCDAQE